MKNKILLSVLFISLFLTACGGDDVKVPSKVDEFGEIQSTESEKEEENENKTVSLPYYDITSLPLPQDYKENEKFEAKSSYYKNALSSRTKQCYDEIYNASSLMDSEVALSKSVTPAELENVMNIIYLDTPELFMLDTSYGYHANSDGYIEKVYLNYAMSQEEVEEYNLDIASLKPRVLEMRNKNDYQTVTSVITFLFDTFNYEQVSLNKDGIYDYSPESLVLSGVKNGRCNSLGVSKKLSYWLRQCGINTTLSSGELIISSDKFESPMVLEYMPYKSETVDESGIYHVDLNYPTYWFWNMVEIDGNWYNLDYTYSRLLNVADKEIDVQSLYFVPDIVLSQTRLSYKNEDLLGISPSCTDNQYQKSYRNGKYMLTHTDVQMTMRLEQEIAQIDQTNARSAYYQFQDEQTFNYFLDKFEAQVSYYNDTYGDPIGSYNLVACRDALVIYINEIINNF